MAVPASPSNFKPRRPANRVRFDLIDLQLTTTSYPMSWVEDYERNELTPRVLPSLTQNMCFIGGISNTRFGTQSLGRNNLIAILSLEKFIGSIHSYLGGESEFHTNLSMLMYRRNGFWWWHLTERFKNKINEKEVTCWEGTSRWVSQNFLFSLFSVSILWYLPRGSLISMIMYHLELTPELDKLY